MPYARLEPSGCAERYGLVRVRLAMCLEEGDVRYNDPSKFFVTDWNSPEALAGFKGKTVLNEEGEQVPVDWEEYKAWKASLPRIWLPEREFHNHFVAFDPYTLRDEDIEAAIAHHLPNFYQAWIDEWDKVKGGMGHGWDIADRARLKRYNKLEPELYPQRKLDCLSKVAILKESSFTTRSTAKGETFPATAIDVGPGADVRGSNFPYNYTLVCLENPANDTGVLTTMQFLFEITAGFVKCGVFHGTQEDLDSGDYEYIGTVGTGVKTFTGLDCDVTIGDYLGIYWKNYGILERDLNGSLGVWWIMSDIFGLTGQSLSLLANDAVSIYATGSTAPPPVDETYIDGIDLADNLVAEVNAVLSDGLDINDSLLAEVQSTITDGFDVDDSLVTWFGFGKVLSDGIALADTLLKGVSAIITDGVRFADSLVKRVEAVITDGVRLADTVVKGIGRVVTDGIALSDIASRLVERVLADGIAFTDCVTRWRWLTAIRNLTRRRCVQDAVREHESVDDGNI